MTLLGHGAEAKIEQDGNLVHKIRYAKSYRHPELDTQLRTSRTNREKKILERLATVAIRVPKLFDSADATTLSLEFIAGKKLRDLLLAQPQRTVELEQLGQWIALLHEQGIIHGDLTTSNVLVDAQGPVLIDFGLAQFSKKTEDRAVDLHVLEEALESTHPRTHELLFRAFLEGYAQAPFFQDVLARLEVVRSRGRNKQ